jgi:hypothetical protein
MSVRKYRGERVYMDHYPGERFQVVARLIDGEWKVEWTERGYEWVLVFRPELASANMETKRERIDATLMCFRRKDELIEFEDECVYEGSKYRAKTTIRLRDIVNDGSK